MKPRTRPIRSMFAALLIAAATAGCSGAKNPAAWFGSGSKSQASATVFYAGGEDLPVLDSPKASAKVIGRLTLHQKLTRSKVENGYARIRTSKGDLEGWVLNSKLIWRLPAKATGGAAVEIPQDAAGEAAPASEAPQAPGEGAPPAPEVAPAGEADSTNDSGTAAPAQPAPRKPSKRPRSGASVFDPY